MLLKKRGILLLVFCVYNILLYAQSTPPNKPWCDRSWYYFGIHTGVNSLYTNMVGNKNLPLYDSIMSFNSESGLGYQIGVIGDVTLLPFVHARLLPGVSFSERAFNYLVIKDDVLRKRHKTMEVIYIDIPAEITVNAKRWHNFNTYLIGGVRWCWDLGSIRRKKIDPDDIFFKVKDKELFYTLGAGFDLFLPYCKIGLELKSSFGLTDILDHGFVTPYSECIDKMKSQLFYITFTIQ